jgi:hypothetical protein
VINRGIAKKGLPQIHAFRVGFNKTMHHMCYLEGHNATKKGVQDAIFGAHFLSGTFLWCETVEALGTPKCILFSLASSPKPSVDGG